MKEWSRDVRFVSSKMTLGKSQGRAYYASNVSLNGG